MVGVLFGPSGAGKTTLLREIESSPRFNGEVFPSPIRGIVKAGLLPDPRRGGLEARMFQIGLTSILFEAHERIARVHKNRRSWALIDRSFIDTFPYWAARLGMIHPLQEDLIERFLEITDVAIYVPPFTGAKPSEYAEGTDDRKRFDELYSYLRYQKLARVRMLTSEAIPDRVEEVLSILEEVDASLGSDRKGGGD